MRHGREKPVPHLILAGFVHFGGGSYAVETAVPGEVGSYSLFRAIRADFSCSSCENEAPPSAG